MKKVNIFEELLSLVEWKNVSNNVKAVGDEIVDMIFNATKRQIESDSIKLSPALGYPYAEGSFDYSFKDGTFGTLDTIKVSYTVYLIDSYEGYNAIIRGENTMQLNSESDYEGKKMRIVSGLVGGYLAKDFTENVYHELNHLYEYSQGMQKNVNLYDTVINVVNGEIAADELTQQIALTIYYTFKHEQDAFVHQFYGFLTQEHPHGEFDELIRYSEYPRLESALGSVMKKSNGSVVEIEKRLGVFGLTIAKYNKRISYGLPRLERKLKNAFRRYCIEYRQTEMRVRIDKIFLKEDLSKRYRGIDWMYEQHFTF